MTKIGRLAGAILVDSEEGYFLVGDFKEPCDFKSHGFDDPGVIDAMTNPYIRLTTDASHQLKGPLFVTDLKGEQTAKILSERFLIERNASVSNRLWNIVIDAEENRGKSEVNIDSVLKLPKEIWDIVREGVLKCV